MILLWVLFFFTLVSLQVTPSSKNKASKVIKGQTPDRPLLLSFAGGQTRFGTFPFWTSKEIRAVPLVTIIDGSPLQRRADGPPTKENMC